jgi:hypothetical protein
MMLQRFEINPRLLPTAGISYPHNRSSPGVGDGCYEGGGRRGSQSTWRATVVAGSSKLGTGKSVF